MRLPTRVQNRRGFALVLVIVTIVVLLGFWAMAYRETASLIRVESSRLLNQTRAVQSVHAMTALDRALTLLEVKAPPNRQIYVYTVNVTPSEMFTVTYTPTNLPGANQRLECSSDAAVRGNLDGRSPRPAQPRR